MEFYQTVQNFTQTVLHLTDTNEESHVLWEREPLMNLRRLFVSTMHFNYTLRRIGFNEASTRLFSLLACFVQLSKVDV